MHCFHLHYFFYFFAKSGKILLLNVNKPFAKSILKKKRCKNFQENNVFYNAYCFSDQNSRTKIFFGKSRPILVVFLTNYFTKRII
jgi:hypothetical protein